jgi:diguanylate cyclase (GGDEF)-like protein
VRVLEGVASSVLVVGSLGCLAAGLLRPAARSTALALAAALALGAGSYVTDSSLPVLLAVLASALALVFLALHRFGGVPLLSVLDAVMGATSGTAVMAAIGAGTESMLAVGVVAGGLALSRWQPSPDMLLVSVGTIALAAGEVVAPAAAPLLAAAAWRIEPRVGPGPEFRWTVLGAIIVFATAALTLLALGQFTMLSNTAGALAIVTVLAGMARAGLTVTDRLRETNERALTDDLTGLGNRRHLVQRLQAAIDRGSDLALLLIDLDGFKELNDTLGHHAGDEVLRQIGPRLGSAVREHDTLARLGGDEFALVLAPGDEPAASTAGLRLRGALERSFHVEDIVVHIDASVGIALFPEHATDPIGLLQRADVAMYEAKRMRTGHEVYLPSRDRHSRERLALIGELRAAIDAGQLAVHYQPKADLPSGAVRSVEALVRWNHPRRGLLTPGHFLPLAEQSGLTRALTAFVLDRALSEIDALGVQPELAVAVNLGPADLLDLGLPSDVARTLERLAFPAERLTLEVSEDVIVSDPERTLDVLERLRALGLRLALDDFGAGRSSLAHLKKLRLDELKIDRAFVLELTASKPDMAIVRSTIDLGHRLGLHVVAEGVATQEAWELLAEYGCDDAQGHLLAAPMPADELAAWLTSRPAAGQRGPTSSAS